MSMLPIALRLPAQAASRSGARLMVGFAQSTPPDQFAAHSTPPDRADRFVS